MGVCLFDNVSAEFFRERFGIDNEMAGLIIGLPSLVVIFLCPLAGWLIDKVGGKTIFLMIASYLLLVAYGFLAFLPKTHGSYLGVYGMLLIGLSNSIFSTALYPCMAYVVPKQHLSTAFGLFMSACNFALAGGPPVVGMIQDSLKGKDPFFWVAIFMLTLLAISLASDIWLFLYDIKGSMILLKKDQSEEYF